MKLKNCMKKFTTKEQLWIADFIIRHKSKQREAFSILLDLKINQQQTYLLKQLKNPKNSQGKKAVLLILFT